MKQVKDTHIIGERGVIQFHLYCNKHEPYIIFRELIQNDFGVDGEVEVVKMDDNGKKYATGEIIKVQIKSTEKDDSYIRGETKDSFTFYASKNDISYWSSFGFDLILIIYDDRNEKLYCKKIPKMNVKTSKTKKESVPILFSKTDNLLEIGDNNFTKKYSHNFRTRVNYSSKDTLGSNLIRLLSYPKFLYEYKTNFKNKKAIFEVIEGDDAPYFAIYSNKIYTFYEINGKSFSKFHSAIITESKPIRYTYNQIKENQTIRNHFIENINLILKDVLGQKGIYYHRKYRRFYFIKFRDTDTRTVTYKTRVHKNTKDRDVVSYHEYGSDHFYRHIAFEVDYIFDGVEVYLVVNPKYLFTLNGKETMTPKKISKYTNFKTAREFNNAVINQIHFILDYLCNGKDYFELINYDKIKLQLSRPIELIANFSIVGLEQKNINQDSQEQNLLF